MNYFEYSQSIRTQIELEFPLMQTLETIFEQGTQIAGTKFTTIYRVGMTCNGIFVALREFHLEGRAIPFIDYAKKILECYATNADRLDSEGEEVVSFCVGFQHGEKVGLLLEDLTAGGQFRISHGKVGEPKGIVHRPDGDRIVFIDIDNKYDNHAENQPLRYFSDDALIKL
ncbi:MAG: hypothetical protein ABIJ34_09150 [archaeon]